MRIVRLVAKYFRLPLIAALYALVGGVVLLVYIDYPSAMDVRSSEAAQGITTTVPIVLDLAWQSLVPMTQLALGIMIVVAVINWGVHFFGDRTSKDLQEVEQTDRSALFLRLTILIQIASFMIYPIFICGCHFHFIAFVVILPAIGWGFYPYFFYRTRRERIVGYVAMALSLFSLCAAWESNIQFAFMR